MTPERPYSDDDSFDSVRGRGGQPTMYDLALRIERIETRLNERQNDMQEFYEENRRHFADIIARLDKRDGQMNSDYITKIEFEPIKKLVYGAVGFILLAVLGAFMVLITRQPTERIISSPAYSSPQVLGKSFPEQQPIVKNGQ